MGWTLIDDWQSLPGVCRARPDPYIVWAELTRWRDFFAPGQEPHIAVLLELESAEARPAFLAAVDAFSSESAHIRVAQAYRQPITTRFLSARVTMQGLAALADASQGPGAFVARCELSQPIVPRRANVVPVATANALPARAMPAGHAARLSGDTLIGIIDDGCAFAHADFTRWGDGGLPVSRVAVLWDQGEPPAFRQAGVGHEPSAFFHGQEVWRSYPSGLPALRGLNDLLAAHAVARHRLLDEDACYASVGYDAVRKRVAHGCHAMGLLCGRIPLAARLPLDAPHNALDADGVPTWQPGGDVAGDAARSDLAFVQLPSACLQDGSGLWLGSQVLDGLRFIVGAADRKRTRRVIVSLGYGPTVGPHDGSSLLEQAMDELSDTFGTDFASLDIVLAAGNAFDKRRHAVMPPGGAVTWRVPPGSEGPQFLQAWMSSAQAEQATVTVSAPGQSRPIVLRCGQVAALSVDGETQAVAALLPATARGAQDKTMLLLAVGPTASFTDRPAPHGDWQVALGTASGAEASVYVAGTESNVGYPLRVRPSMLVDEQDDPERYLRAASDDVSHDPGVDESLRQGAVLRRRGSLSGIGTGQSTQVVAGYVLNGRRHAHYSSAGDHGAQHVRTPTLSKPTDVATTLPGVRAAGTRSGCVVRLKGTSSAAPQWARDLANSPDLNPLFGKRSDDDLFGTQGQQPVRVGGVASPASGQGAGKDDPTAA